MLTFIATDGKTKFSGGIVSCLDWASSRIQLGNSSVVKVLKVRAGEKNARVFAEVDALGIRMIERGRSVGVKVLNRI